MTEVRAEDPETKSTTARSATAPGEAEAIPVADATQAADASALERVGRGESEALGEIFDRHASVMLGLARRILGNTSDAEDLIHDVFVEVARKAGTYDPERSRVRSWLLMRVRSRAIDRLRTFEVARRAHRMEQLNLESNHALEVVDPGELSEDARRARDAMRYLTANQLVIVERAYFHGESLREISEALSIPLGTVKSRLAAALERLRGIISQAASHASETSTSGTPGGNGVIDRAAPCGGG